MADSVTETQDQPATEDVKPAGPLVKLVRNPNGTMREVRTDEKGRFLRKIKTMPSTRDVTLLMRNFLNAKIADENGKIDKKSMTHMEKMLKNIFEIASNNNSDPKAMAAAVAAFEAIMLRAHGKPKANDEELDALKLAGVKIVVINAPQLMTPEIVTEERVKPVRPSFIDAEVVHTNPSTES